MEFIDFSECLENYASTHYSSDNLRRMQELNQWDDEQSEKYRRASYTCRLVADRNILEPPWDTGPYIEFYTDPPTRFNFDSKEEFHTVRMTLEQYGWQTHDLS